MARYKTAHTLLLYSRGRAPRILLQMVQNLWYLMAKTFLISPKMTGHSLNIDIVGTFPRSLRVMIDENLTWHSQVDLITKKVNKSFLCSETTTRVC